MKLDEKLARIEMFADAIISEVDCKISKALATGIKVQLESMSEPSKKKTRRATVPFKHNYTNGKITTKEMSKMLGRHEQTIMKWARDGKLGEATPEKVGAGRTEGYVWDCDLVLEFVKDNLGGK